MLPDFVLHKEIDVEIELNAQETSQFCINPDSANIPATFQSATLGHLTVTIKKEVK